MKPDQPIHGNSLHRSQALARTLAEPKDYFRGIQPPAALAPTEILLYTRNTAERILASNIGDRDIHHRFVLIVPLSASGRMSVDAATFNLSPGNAALVFPFQFHHYERISENEVLWLFVTFELNDESALQSLRGAGPLVMDLPAQSEMESILEAYLQEPAPSAIIGLRLEMLLRHLSLSVTTTASPSPPPAVSPGNSESILSQVNAWVLERMERSFRLPDLAAALGYSESHLRALFRERTHLSLGRHIARLRLLKSCQLLLGTNRRVSEIAGLCGYDSLYAFSRAFRREFGTTPSAYRQKVTSYNSR